MNISIWQYILSMSVYIILLFLMIEYMRKNYKAAAIFWLLSLLSFPLWFYQLEGWFRWVKTFSVLLPTAIIVGYGRMAHMENRTKGWMKHFKKDWVLWTLYGVLGLNILEASLKDLALGNYYNAVAGFVLIITIPLVKSRKGKIGWKIESKKPGDLLVYTDPIWNFLYTTWNIAFVFGENPGYAASSLSILLAAELYPIIKKRPELYVISRVYTLAAHILIRATYDIFTPIMDSSQFANPTIVYYWGIINMAISLPYLFYYFYKKNKEEKSATISKTVIS